MILAVNGSAPAVVGTVLEEFIESIVAQLPRLLSGIVFLLLAYLAIKVVTHLVRSILDPLYPADQSLVVDLGVTLVGLILWFGALLALLKILGMGEVAASLGTATGFVALGVAFALKEMIADTVSGVYLLRDPDFSEGDTVTTAGESGTVVRIDLRKTRIRTPDGDLVVLANRDVEKKWVNKAATEGE